MSPNSLLRTQSFTAEPRSGLVPACEVGALTPSSTTQTRGMIGFAPKLLQPKRAIPNPGPNEQSVALLVRFGGHSVLLGADLEVGSSNAVG